MTDVTRILPYPTAGPRVSSDEASNPDAQASNSNFHPVLTMRRLLQASDFCLPNYELPDLCMSNSNREHDP